MYEDWNNFLHSKPKKIFLFAPLEIVQNGLVTSTKSVLRNNTNPVVLVTVQVEVVVGKAGGGGGGGI